MEEEAVRCVGYLGIYRIRICEQLTSGVPSAAGLGEGLISPHFTLTVYKGHLESKEHFAIKKYLLIIGKKKNMQVLSHIFTYFST